MTLWGFFLVNQHTGVNDGYWMLNNEEKTPFKFVNFFKGTSHLFQYQVTKLTHVVSKALYT